MKTYISKKFNERIEELSTIFAETHSAHLQGRYRTQSFNAIKKQYLNIATALYLKVFKFSPNKNNFEFNHIKVSALKELGKRNYRDIIDDLIENEIIVVNEKYFFDLSFDKALKNPNRNKNEKIENKSFTKSYLLHSSFVSGIHDSIYRLNYKSTLIDISDSILDIFSFLGNPSVIISGEVYKSDKLIGGDETKLDKEYNRTITTEEMKNTEYSKLTYDEDSLIEFCQGDELAYHYFKGMLKKLDNTPDTAWNRLYHVFHQLSKEFREKVLRLDGEPIKEVFDIPASDLHMIAKTIENIDSIPIKEIKRFQQLVKDDFRKIFGTRKDGKCTENTKLAFKKYLNKQKNQYSNIRTGSTQHKIDEYFKENIPNVREFIINFKEITTDKKTSKALWAECMNLEYETMSIRLRNILDREKHIKSLTCHDSIYVKVSDLKKFTKQEIINYFYEAIDLLIDRENKFFEI